jgi:hypothetical protein
MSRQRLECVEPAPALAHPRQTEGASKLDAPGASRVWGRATASAANPNAFRKFTGALSQRDG